MPLIHFIVRFEADNATKSSCRTFDITKNGLPLALEVDTKRTVKTYTVIDDKANDGPWTYTFAFEIIKMEGKDMHVSFGTVSYTDAVDRMVDVVDRMREIDPERIRNDNTWNKDPEDEMYDVEDTEDRAEITWETDHCVRIRLREKKFLWYELCTVNAEDRAKWTDEEQDIDNSNMDME
jgi:hypothetical protein